MKKKLFFILIFIFTLIIGVNAQDKISDTKKLVKLMNSEKMVDEMMDNIIPVLKDQASLQLKGDDSKIKLDNYLEFLITETKELSNKIINNEMVSIYSKHFNHEEIKELIKFYESSIGKKMIEKTPLITTDLMSSMFTKYMPELQEKITKKMNELK